MIRYACPDDLDALQKADRHIRGTELEDCIRSKRILMMFSGETFIGWLRFGRFWDEIPFMNMLYFREEYRGKGYGARLVRFWEEEMRKSGTSLLLTSTRSDEQAQHFYRKLGYTDCGSLLLPGEPAELFLLKRLENGKKEEK